MKESSKQQDKILIIKASQGEAEAFGAIFDKYHKSIYRFIYFKVSSQEVAEDLASQSFLKAWEQISLGAKVKNFSSWLYRIARNLVIDYYRSRQKDELPLIYEMEGIANEPQFDPDTNLTEQELKKVLFSLKNDIREIIVLRYIEGLSIKEIARITEKSPVNIRVIIHRALKQLQNNLQKK